MRLVSWALASAMLTGLSLLSCLSPASADPTESATRKEFAKQDQKRDQACFQCHRALNPALAADWRDSAHAKKGVGCYD
ncbi:MAG TPA: hypothetical protein VIK28_06060, partial [Sedimentisphaerales bacterium]